MKLIVLLIFAVVILSAIGSSNPLIYYRFHEIGLAMNVAKAAKSRIAKGISPVLQSLSSPYLFPLAFQLF